jgi:hypothetical protein
MADSHATLRLKTAFDLVCEMEEDLQRVGNLARALMMMGGYLDEDDAAPIAEVAWHIRDHARALESRRDALFRLLRPNSTHLSKRGWPDEKADEAA